MIRIGIFGYGNLAKGVELAVNAAGDMELVAIFTRRAPESVKTNTSNVPVVSVDDVLEWVEQGSSLKTATIKGITIAIPMPKLNLPRR